MFMERIILRENIKFENRTLSSPTIRHGLSHD